MNIYTIHPHSLTATVTLGSVLLDDISDVTLFIQMTLVQERAIISPNVSLPGVHWNLIVPIWVYINTGP